MFKNIRIYIDNFILYFFGKIINKIARSRYIQTIDSDIHLLPSNNVFN